MSINRMNWDAHYVRARYAGRYTALLNVKDFPSIVHEISLDSLRRIDVALEGNWSLTVVTVWSKEKGLLGFSNVVQSHPTFKPSLELYFDNAWLGIHCYRRTEGQSVFDEEFARRVIDYAESRVVQEL